MPITFTEEDFVQSSAQPKAGFFSEKDFAPTGKKTREQVMAEVQAAQAQRDLVSPPEQMSGLESVLASPSTEAITQQFANPFRTLAVGLTEPQRLVGGRGGINAPSVIDQSPITPEMVKGVLESPLLNKSMIGSSGPGSGMEGVQNFVSHMTSGLVAPVPLAQMMAGGGLAKMGLPQQGAASVAAGFVPSMVTDVPQAVQGVGEAFSGGSNQQKVEETLRLMTDVVFPMLMMKGAVTPKPVEQSEVRIAENRNPIYDAPKGGDLIGPERQLPAPGERPTSVPGTPMDRPAGGARFGVDPLGKVVDLSQLTLKEQVELYRGPKESVPREQYVRPAQQAPVVIVEQAKPQRPIVFQNETGPIEPVSVPVKAPVEPSGGKVSFRAPASAQGIPSARQSVVGPKPEIKPPVVFQNETEPEAPAKPVVAKLSTSGNKNPLGDPMGTTYYATPEDWSAWQKVQTDFMDLLSKGAEFDGPEMMKVRQENENIKNRYGGMPPVEPKSGGMQIKAAMKRGQERRGETGAIFPTGEEGKVTQNKEGQVLNKVTKSYTKAKLGGPAFFKTSDGYTALLSKTPTEGVYDKDRSQITQAWRVSYWSPNGTVIGHNEFSRWTEAFSSLGQEGATSLLSGKKWIEVDQPDSTIKPKSGGIGGGIKGAVEKNKEAGSVENPFARIVEKSKNKEMEKRGDTFALSGLRIALDPKDPEQVEGRFYMNPVGPVAKQAVKDIKELGNKVIEGSKPLKEYYKGAPEVKGSGFNPERGQLLPDFQPKEVANKVAATPFGSEKIPVLGRLMGGKARIRTPQDQAVAAWYMERHGVGPAVASSVGEIIRGQVNGVFKVSENGDLNVKPTMLGQSLKMSDVFEGLRKDPLSYELTVPQRKVFKNVIEPITKRMTELGQKYKILDEIVDESGDFKPYFPRIVTKHPKIEDKSPTSQFKSRAFNSEAEGWKRGYEYELDPEKRLVTGIERLYRAIANKRLATDPILGAKSEAQLKSEIKMSYAEKLATGEITQAKIDRIAEGIRTRGQVMQPILVRSIFDPVTAKMLNKEFAAEQSTIRKNITSANSMLKALQLGFDLGVGQIQLLPLLYAHPKQWGQAMVGSVKGMFNPEFLSEYVRQNKEAVSELAQLGSSVGRLQEHMSGLGGEGLLGKTPVVGQVSQAFGRQFQTAMDVAKIELWKALKEGAPKDEWPKLVRAVETLTLSGRSENAMVPHGRALLERVLLLAPSYYRGAIEHIAALGERGASGKAVRQSMGRFILGSAITYYAVATALQMSQDEIAEGFNPANTSFMTWKVKMEDGSVVNVGFGGIFRSFLKLGANITKSSIEHPENWKSLSSEKNPITRWYRGHAGPTVGAAWDGFSGEDFLGRPADLGTLAKGRLPLLAQEALRRPEEPKATPLDFGASTFGLTTTPESFGDKRVRVQEEVAKAKYGKEFKNLGTTQRAQVDKEVEKKLSGVPTGMTKEKSREVAMKMGDEKVKELKEGLSEGVRSWMEEKKVEVGGYQSTRTVGGKQIRLTKEEGERLREIMIAEYEKSLEKLRTHPRIGKMSGEELQRYVNVHLENARKKGWAVMSREIRDNAKGSK